MRENFRGDRDRCDFRSLLPDSGCIDQWELADFRSRSLPTISDDFWAKCVATRRICGGVATASRKATLPAAGCLSNRRELPMNLRAGGVVDLRAKEPPPNPLSTRPPEHAGLEPFGAHDAIPGCTKQIEDVSL